MTIGIRPYRMEDIEAVYAASIESREHVSLWMDWIHPGYSRVDTRAWVTHCVTARQHDQEYEFLIIDADTHHILGSCGLNSINHKDRFCNLGYWVRRSALGQGIAREAALLIRDFAFSRTKLQRLEIVVAVGNEASRRTAESTGAHYEGILKKRLTLNNTSHDAHMFAFIKD